MMQAALALANRQPANQTSLISTPTHANANAQRASATALCQLPISRWNLANADVMNTNTFALLTCLTSTTLAASAHAMRLKFLSIQ